MQENISPEERLLNLIKKGEAKPEEPQKPEEVPVDKPAEKPETKLEKKSESKYKVNLKKYFKRVKKAKTKDKIQKPVKPAQIEPGEEKDKVFKVLSLLNKILVAGIILALGFMIYGFVISYKSETDIPTSISQKSGGGIDDATPEPQPALNHYTGVLSKRKMFKLYEAPRPKQKAPEKPKVTLQQLLAGYTFVGIIFGDEPQAIVEEKKSGQSYYLTEGQFLGEIKIEKIDKGKVSVTYDEQTMEIRI